jgi:uncharacterized protein (TIGR02271 family)
MKSEFNQLGDHIKRMSDAHGYAIEPGDPDPRGWKVVLDNEPIGVVEDLLIDTEKMKVRYFEVRLDAGTRAGANAGGHALVDATAAQVSGNRVVLRDMSMLQFGQIGSGERAAQRDRSHEGDARVTRSEEELRVGKREVVRGEARVSKHVETEHVRQPVTTRHEELVIERRPVEAVTGRDATIGDDEVRIPLHGEEVVVEKRPVVKEEVVIGKRMVEESTTVEADVRRERLDIDEGRTVTDSRGSRDRQRDEF